MVIDTAKLDRGFYAVGQNGALYSVVHPPTGFSGIGDTIELKPFHFSNGDHIRHMTNDELAKMWRYYVDCGECPTNKDCNRTGQECLRRALDWLRKDATDELG